MAGQIRQEINIADNSGVAVSTNTGALIQLDTAQYNGTVTYYFEVEATSTTNDRTISLVRKGTSTADATKVVTGGLGMALYRSTAFTPPTGKTEYFVADLIDSTELTIKSARIIVIQNFTGLGTTETQIEIGNASNTTTTTDTALTNPKYWQYTGANWNGTITVYFESTFKTGTSKSAATMTLQTSTDILAPSWSNVASSAVTTTNTVPDRVRSGAITLVAGNWYRAVMKAGNSKSGITVYNAKVIIDQVGTSATGSYVSQSNTGTGSGALTYTATTTAIGQSFAPVTSGGIINVSANLYKVGSPTGNMVAKIYAHSGTYGSTGVPTGAALGTSDNLNPATLTGSIAKTTFTFSTPVTISGGTNYFLVIEYTSSNFPTDYVNIENSGLSYSGNEAIYTGTWAAVAGVDLPFEVVVGTFTKLEPQYLLANTLFAAGTALQLFLTKWDSTEWDAGSGTIGYYFQAEAANGSTSDVTLEQADGGGTVTNSTLTNIDNAQISTAMTMPGNENLDTKATTNAGDVAGARILVYYVFSPAATRTPRSPGSIGHPFMV